MAGEKRIVYNSDVAGLHRRINRFIVEMAKSASNQSSLMSEFDQNRLSSYLSAIRSYVGWIVAQPQLDLPETSPKEYALDADPEVPVVENEAIVDILRMLEVAREEMVNGQSARMPCGLIKFDVARLDAIISKLESFLQNYVSVVTPLDLPESSPSRPIQSKGATGV